MRKDKKGDLKYDTIGTLIIGLLILVIGFAWMFSSIIAPDEIDWEICRESLIARNALPEKDLGIVVSSKGALDLKCKTQTVTIDYKDTDKAEKIIGETISSCWYMVGRGDYKVFPGSASIFTGKKTPCMMCSRIHMDSEVREFYSEKENQINLKQALDNPLEGYDVSVWDYLNPERGAQAIPYFKGWNDTGFWITGVSDFSVKGFNPEGAEVFLLPKYFLPERGDLFITYAEPTKEESFSSERAIDPYMFFLQEDDFDLLNWAWASYIEITDFIPFTTWSPEKSRVKICSSIESIPS